MTHQYCTYFDQNYLDKGLALYQSLRSHDRPFLLWVLCLDDVTYDVLGTLNLDSLYRIRLSQLEDWDPQLRKARDNRSLVEYYWTCTPSLVLYLLSRLRDANLITYVDSDLYFFSDPGPLYAELEGASIAIHEHRFAADYAYLRKTSGTYNVGLVAFRNDSHALDCLGWWREQVLHTCILDGAGGYCGDQKYLNDWPTRFGGVVVLQHRGLGVAPWNVSRYDVRLTSNGLFVDDQPLIFYHYHSLKRFGEHLYRLASETYALSESCIRAIYSPYLSELHSARQAIRRVLPNFNGGRSPFPYRYYLGYILWQRSFGNLFLWSS